MLYEYYSKIMDIVQELLDEVESKEKILHGVNEINTYLEITYKDCCEKAFANNAIVDENDKTKIDSILDYVNEILNTGYWSDVPLHIRESYSCCSFVKSIIELKLINEQKNVGSYETILKTLDMGLLLGAPVKDNNNLLTKCASIVTKFIHNKAKEKCKTQAVVAGNQDLKRKHQMQVLAKLNGRLLKKISLPSVEEFYTHYMLPQMPVIITDSISHWPACKKWMDVNYLLDIAGNRTVPIEIGSQYTDENWSQKLMTLKDFIRDYYLQETKGDVGYLAQHDLLYQIPELRDDICIPDYCCLTRNATEEASEPEINAWFGPTKTISSLHYDPKDNLLAQVFGSKQVLLFSPEDTEYLYPHEGKLLSNTSQLDPLNPDMDKFPNFSKATMYNAILESGEMLYIPPKWWHHVVSLEKSFSVNFWWQ